MNAGEFLEVASLTSARGLSGRLSHAYDPYVVQPIDPEMGLLGRVRCCLFREALFVRAAHADGNVSSQRFPPTDRPLRGVSACLAES